MKTKRSRYSSVLNYISLFLLVAVVVWLAIRWHSLPDRIPGHYNASGAVDRWGGKGELLLLPAISWVLYLMITAVESVPKYWNTGVKVTEKNRDRVFRILGNLIATMKLIMVAVFTFLTANSASAGPLPAWFLPVSAAVLIGSMAFFFVQLSRAR